MSAVQDPPRRRRPGLRRLAVAALVMFVTWVHLGVGDWWVEQGLADTASPPPPPAIQVSFVKEMAPAAPPVVRAAPPRAKPRPAPPSAEPAASAPPPAASEPVLTMNEGSESQETPPAAPAVPNATENLIVEAAPFDWPPSSRLSYTMTGNYRGPIQGDAQVDWLRDGQHYQVRLEVNVPPLFTRRMLSDGVLSPQGLSPRRYDQETQVALQTTRRETIMFSDDTLQLANGRTDIRPAGVQDTASQFVQMTWLFLTHPERLQVGATVDFPLALARRVGQWTYRVAERGPVQLPFGEIEAFHLVPQRDQARPNELSVETWVAPTLMYLPVRIVIRQDADTYLDLQLKSAPRVTAPAP